MNHALDCVAWGIMRKNFGAGQAAGEQYAAVVTPAGPPPAVAGIRAKGHG